MSNLPKVSLIYARSLNGVIGNNNDLPGWNIPGDLKRFKELTQGGIVIMGYKTWMSLPERFRPLKDRINIVLTTRQDMVSDPAEGLYFTTSKEYITDIVNTLQEEELRPVWIIGGASVYEIFEKHVNHIYETVVMSYVDGDVEYKHDRKEFDLESESVVGGSFNGVACNVHHRVWRRREWFEDLSLHEITHIPAPWPASAKIGDHFNTWSVPAWEPILGNPNTRA